MWKYTMPWVVAWAAWQVGASPSDGRSSDPHIQQGVHHEIHSFPSEVALGNPDTMETDIPGAPLSPADFENSAVMIPEAVDTSHQADPIELAGLFQGDIMLVPRDQLKELNMVSPDNKERWAHESSWGVGNTIISVFLSG
ncbi:uncharacterized protein LOC134769385 [Penaeus indicus]|uniref:uncharacterized protein LOC134769385 n=1 Tax=Penaeus indicus TaxID=29960 RepID=UPI00300D75D1